MDFQTISNRKWIPGKNGKIVETYSYSVRFDDLTELEYYIVTKALGQAADSIHTMTSQNKLSEGAVDE